MSKSRKNSIFPHFENHKESENHDDPIDAKEGNNRREEETPDAYSNQKWKRTQDEGKCPANYLKVKITLLNI